MNGRCAASFRMGSSGVCGSRAGYGFVRRVPVFDEFTAGAGEGLRTCVKVLPSPGGSVDRGIHAAGVGAAGADYRMDCPGGGADRLTRAGASVGADAAGVGERFPGGAGKPVPAIRAGQSGGAGSLGYAVLHRNDLYTIAVYYGAVGVKRTRHTLAASASADMMGVFVSALAVWLLLGGG